MDKNAGNAIKRARLAQGITQEKLAEMSGYSADAISAWENGVRQASVPVLELLAVCLSAPWLTGVYLREQANGALDDIVPAFTPGKPLSAAAVRVLNGIYAFSDKHRDRRLLSIAVDDIITPEERQEYDEGMKDLQEIVAAAMELRYCAGGE